MLWLHAFASWWLVGVGLTVTLVQYPTFRVVAPGEFVAFHARHSTGMVLVVAVPWLTQGVTALAVLLGAYPAAAKVVVGFSAVAVLITVTVIVPAHGRLSDGFFAAAHATLTRADRVRTAAFLLHAVAVSVVAYGFYA